MVRRLFGCLIAWIALYVVQSLGNFIIFLILNPCILFSLLYQQKTNTQTRELSCLVQFEHNNLYLGVGYKKKYKAPTDHVLCMKHPKIQNMKSKHILYLCADDSKSMYQWLTGIRMAKVCVKY